MSFWRGVGDIVYMATMAGAAPAAAEIASGVTVADGVTAITGFEDSLNRIAVPLLANSADVQVNGPSTYADSSLTLVEDDGTGSAPADVARRLAITTLAKNTTGYLVFCRTKKKAAMIAAVKVDVFPILVATSNKQWTLDANVSARLVSILITDAVKQDVAILS